MDFILQTTLELNYEGKEVTVFLDDDIVLVDGEDGEDLTNSVSDEFKSEAYDQLIEKRDSNNSWT